MDSHSFVGDFGVGLPSDNHYLNQLNLGGSGGMDLGGNGLDFSGSMMMLDSNSLMGGNSGSSSAGMIDFPDELNSPTAASSSATAGSASLSMSSSTTTSVDAIPFPASLASEPMNGVSMDPTVSTAMSNTMPNAMANGMPNMNMPNRMVGMDMNLGMNMNMNMNPNAGFMPDPNQMFMQGYPMQQGNMMMNPQAQYYFQQQQQQQQQYMRMLQQRQFAAMQQQQQQNVLLQQAQTQQNQAQVHRQQQQAMAAATMAMQQPTSMPMTNSQSTQQASLGRSAQPQMAGAQATHQRQFNGASQAGNGQAMNGPGTASARPTWQSSADQALRKEMLNHIMRVLQSQRSNAPANWLQKLPDMAHRLEDECYRTAASREEYANTSTLQTRLKNIVRAAQQPRAGAGARPNQNPAATANPGGPSADASNMVGAGGAIPFPGAQAVSTGPSTATQSPMMSTMEAHAIQMPPELQDPPNQQMKMDPQQTQPMSSPTIDALISDRLSVAESSISSMTQVPDASTGSNVTPTSTAAAAANRSNKSAQIIRQFRERAHQVTLALDETQTTEYHNKLKSMTSSDIKNASSKEVLQRQQQRLLLLRHAMWCKAAEGTCTAAASCGEMKRLWQHMGTCQHTNSCPYSHCISSKYVLSHFQQCTNPKCLVCQVARFPVEVKEKNGTLMMDADRALQQIIAATQRRQAQAQAQAHAQAQAQGHSQAQVQQIQAQQNQAQAQAQAHQAQAQAQAQRNQAIHTQVPQLPTQGPHQAPMNPQQAAALQMAQYNRQQMQQRQALANGSMQNGVATSAPMNTMGMTSIGQQDAGVNQPYGVTQVNSMMPGAGSMNSASGNTLQINTMPDGSAAPAANATSAQSGTNSASDAFAASLTDEDRRQLMIIQQKLRGWNVDQLNLHCKKMESWAEQIRTQMNAIMNECRQLLHLSNTTQDLTAKKQYEAQVNEKRTSLKDLDVKYKRCNSQHRIVRHIISSRSSNTPAASPPSAKPVEIPQQVPKPIPMPTQMQMQPQQPQRQQPHAYGMQMQPPLGVNVHSSPQQQSNNRLQQAAQANGVVKQSPDDILGEEMQMSFKSEGLAAGKPLEMPMDLQDTSSANPQAPPRVGGMPATSNTNGSGINVPGSNQPAKGIVIKQEIPTVKTAPVAQVQESGKLRAAAAARDDSINPLTMNNSKLNAMMMEHKRMDAATSQSSASTSAPIAKSDEPFGPLQTNEMMVPSGGSATPTATPAADVPTSMLNELSNEDLEAHINSLVKYYNATMPPSQVKKRLEGLLKGMMEHKFGWVFSSPVDPVALGIPNYFKIIRRPMDLGTIKKKLDVGVYKQIDQFAHDVRLTFNNAKTYNSEEDDVYNLAKDMLADFNAEMRKLEQEIMTEEIAAREKESACRLCGVERMVFEPAVLYCNGECNSRIRRNCYYYCSSDNKYHCCHPCYANLPDSIKQNEGRTYKKTELSRKKNDEVHEEPWVQCDKCNRWVHQICALFNGKIDAEKKPQQVKTEVSGGSSPKPSANTTNSASTKTSTVLTTTTPSSSVSLHSISSTPGSEFLCPECLLEHRKKEPAKYRIGRHAFNAKDLMRTKLTDFIEQRISRTLQEEREDEAKWSRRDIKDVPTAEHLTVRLVSNIEKQLMVRDKMFTRYKDSHKYTSEHRFKSKCICMFQEIHGVSVLLFGMYVHEFDEQEADCNSRRVYISYLDSVNYFEPAHLRTKVYHELLIAYFEFVKQRGFHTAHLWACPPLKGDDYILYCHPETQKTPKSDRLRQWYIDMLVEAQKEGVVWHITNMYDDYWRNDTTACTLPYFEGDYWVGLAEDLIEKIESEKPKKAKKTNVKRKSSETMKKGNKKSKTKKNKRRKTGNGESDTEPHSDAENENDEDGENNGDDDAVGANGADNKQDGTSESQVLLSLDAVDRTITDPLMKKLGEVIEPMKDDFLVVKLYPCCRVCNKTVLQGPVWRDLSVKTDIGLNPKVVQTALCNGCYQKLVSQNNAKWRDRLKSLTREDMNLPAKCTDPDEVNDSEFFDTRQAFLSLCQGNHYQFDELRRAKHSSMMALYHLGNPNPNAYVYECNNCTRDIITGNRWHCHTCPDFDVCDACYAKDSHEHPLEMVPTSGLANGAGKGTQGHNGAGGAAMTDEQRRQREQRAKNVRLHMQLLVHSSSCADGNCGSSNCEKMKELMRHGSICKQRAYGGCTICRRVWALLQLHARQCRQYECKVPRCHDLREHVRKLQLQQQLMDDRRRAAVTQQYRQLNQQNGEPRPMDEDPAGGGAAL